MALEKNHIVSKRNVLNELRANNMTLQELRFFCIYLGKINPDDLSTRVVRFSISEFQKIMDFDKLRIDYLKLVARRLLAKVVSVPLDEDGSFTAFQLFKRCTVNVNKFNEWYIEIDAHDDALPLMFDFKKQYFTYHLWNALRLKSANQLRMYEILKQYEKVGVRTVSVEELKELLGISQKEYCRYGDFREKVIDICQEALKDNTDIYFTYKPIRGKGRGSKIQFLRFTILKNKDYVDQLSLEDYIDPPIEPEKSEQPNDELTRKLSFWGEACNNEFSPAEIQVFYNLLIKILSPNQLKSDTEVYDYLKLKYDEFLLQTEKTKIIHRFKYMKKMIEAALN